jgi:hypothetical protein
LPNTTPTESLRVMFVLFWLVKYLPVRSHC